ncbi:CRISPR system precrRNA processing endoribonuclease RAMP protein Cas6 [Brevibacillus fluminis]|uniref:CRISPR system precrRNA processing endoribonuclease RAMP protein Cas6 n=1 Tax=Brevibacillus fluminis TaxID=511487 RepID=UPI003F88D257
MFEELRVAQYRFTIEAGERGLELPVWKASTFRGAFGHVFRRLSCVHAEQACASCTALSYCAYPYIFETRPDQEDGFMGKYDQVPRPYLFEVPQDKQVHYEAGDLLTFDLRLFGKAIDYAPLFVTTFKNLGREGIGTGRKPYRLLHVENRDEYRGCHRRVYMDLESGMVHQPIVITGKEIIERERARIEGAGDAGKMIIFFETPLRLKWKGKYTDDVQFHVLFRNLLRRMTGLLQFHHDVKPEWPIRELVERAEKVRLVDKQVKWLDYERYSARQDVKMMMGGIVGWAVYEGELAEFMPWLKAAELIHCGKNTAFDLGRVKVSF